MKKKILFINGHLNIGGVEKSLVDILRHFDYRKYDVDLLLLEELGDYQKEIPKQVNIIYKSLVGTYGEFIPCIINCIKKKDWFSLKMRLIFLLMKYQGQNKIQFAKKMLTNEKHYDCVIGFRSGICTQIAAFATDADKRLTWWHHGEINVNIQEYSEVCKAMDYVVCVSNGCEKMIEEACPEIRDKLYHIPNMLDIERIKEESERYFSYKDNDKFKIVSVGRLESEKHFENIIIAAEYLLKNDIGNFEWHIIGDGTLYEYLQQKIQKHQLEQYVILNGRQNNPYPYIKGAYLYAHPSYVESQGLAILEAMSLGVPCVVTRSLGPSEFIEDGINGVFTEKSPEAFTEMVYKMVTDKELYNKIKENTKCPPKYQSQYVIEQLYMCLES